MSAIVNAARGDPIGERDRPGRTARRPAERSTGEPGSANSVAIEGNVFGETPKTTGETPALPMPKRSNQILNLSRRNFLKSSALAGGGLILGVHVPGLNGSAGAAEQTPSTFVPNAFLRIGKDSSVIVMGNHCEMGQGAYTSGAMTIAEELDVCV